MGNARDSLALTFGEYCEDQIRWILQQVKWLIERRQKKNEKNYNIYLRPNKIIRVDERRITQSGGVKE